jgi:hypothetical protein
VFVEPGRDQTDRGHNRRRRINGRCWWPSLPGVRQGTVNNPAQMLALKRRAEFLTSAPLTHWETGQRGRTCPNKAKPCPDFGQRLRIGAGLGIEAGRVIDCAGQRLLLGTETHPQPGRTGGRCARPTPGPREDAEAG